MNFTFHWTLEFYYSTKQFIMSHKRIPASSILLVSWCKIDEFFWLASWCVGKFTGLNNVHLTVSLCWFYPVWYLFVSLRVHHCEQSRSFQRSRVPWTSSCHIIMWEVAWLLYENYRGEHWSQESEKSGCRKWQIG